MINNRCFRFFFAAGACLIIIAAGCDDQPSRPEIADGGRPVYAESVNGIQSAGLFEISIGRRFDVHQGHYVDVPVTTTADLTSIAGFQLLIAYDTAAIQLHEVLPGRYLADNNWSSLTYKTLHDTAINQALVEITGTAYPTVKGQDSVPVGAEAEAELAVLDFYVTNSLAYECLGAPIRFYWRDCNDNVMYHEIGDTLYLASRVFDYMSANPPVEVTDPTTGWGGPPLGCEDSLPALTIQPIIDCINGLVDFECGCPDYSGDINCNGIKYEIADAVDLSEYFIFGLSPAFDGHIECSIAGSDVNRDGIVLSPADLVYLIRIIDGDAIPDLPPLPDDKITIECYAHNHQLYVNCQSSYDIGAVWLTLDLHGEMGSPVLGAAAGGMDLKYGIDDDYLRILIYNIGSEFIPAGYGNIVRIPFSGDLQMTSAAASDFDGRRLAPSLRNLPYSCEFRPNSPDPFSGQTTISFATPVPADYSLIIYNCLGNTVYRYSGHAGVGVEEHVWQAVDDKGHALPSGIYTYTLTVGGISNTQTMVQIK